MGEVRYGSSPDFSKDKGFGRRLKEQVEKRFTFSGAKKEWYEKHKARVENLQRIEDQLTPEERKKVVDKLNRDANIGAVWTIGKNTLGAMSLLGAVAMGGKIALDAQFRGDMATKLRSFDAKGKLRAISDRVKSSYETIRAKGWQASVKTRGSGIE